MPKKKNKNKLTPPPVEGAKKEEEEKTEDHGEGGTASGPKVAGTLDIGHFSIVLQLIRRLTTTEHHNKQFVNQGLLLAQPRTQKWLSRGEEAGLRG